MNKTEVPNPQELAEKLYDDATLNGHDNFNFGIAATHLGTLLQAERAAGATLQREADAYIFDIRSQACSNPTRADACMAIANTIRQAPLITPESTSALAAVVQRETEKLREKIDELEAQIDHLVHGDDL